MRFSRFLIGDAQPVDGLVLIAGKAVDSRMIQRLLLPLNDDDLMPPEGKPQPTPAEIAALEWWIDRGAPSDTSRTFATDPRF